MSTENRLLYNFIDVYPTANQSAYDVWKKAGNSGDPSEFLEFSKSGPHGNQGEQGPQGLPGKSAYELWLSKPGNEGKSEDEFLNRVLDVIRIEDQNTGDIYSCKLVNGELIVCIPCVGLRIAKGPDKSDYTDTELFDPTGMVIFAVYENGSERDVTDSVEMEYDRFVTTGSSEFKIKIKYNDFIFKNIISEDMNINITTRSLEKALEDFAYTIEDGLYVINDWNGTFNGQPSTECILPNNELVKYS